MLAKPRTEYIIYPDIIWNYEALKNNNQAEPVSVAVMVEMNGKDLGQRLRTFSVRSINECLLGYVTNGTKFHDTGIFFAAYVNEENPMIDKLLREALDTRIVNRFWVIREVPRWWTSRFMPCGMCCKSASSVIARSPIRAFPATWSFHSVCARSMTPWSPRNQLCGVGVCFCFFAPCHNIEPILVRTPGHMFVGYYTDSSHKDMNFLETTMIGDVNLDDFFPDEQLDSTMVGKSQNQMSRITFDKSKEYANKKYTQNKEGIHSGKLNYMFLEISKEVRRRIQPIGK